MVLVPIAHIELPGAGFINRRLLGTAAALG
jgi:hypothetical protein